MFLSNCKVTKWYFIDAGNFLPFSLNCLLSTNMCHDGRLNPKGITFCLKLQHDSKEFEDTFTHFLLSDSWNL